MTLIRLEYIHQAYVHAIFVILLLSKAKMQGEYFASLVKERIILISDNKKKHA